jgi:hypothetical protein
MIANVRRVPPLLAAVVARVPGLAGFGWVHRVQRLATYLLTPVVRGHILIAGGILPGRRGVARPTHLGGRPRRDVSRRRWPGWPDRYDRR